LGPTNILPKEVLKKIVAFEVSLGIENEDKFVLDGSPNGKFAIKSTMNFIQPANNEEEHPFC